MGHIAWNKGLKGIHLSPKSEWKKGDSRLVGNKFKLGKSPWNLGKKYKTGPNPKRKGIHYSPSTEFKKGIHYSPKTQFKKDQKCWWKERGLDSPMLGKKMSNETKEKIRLAHLGKKQSPEHILKNRLSKLGKKHSLETRRKMSQAQIGKKMSKEAIKKMLRRRKMSSLEITFNKIIQKNNLPYKFVGNGKFFIERKNPDFININGEKKAVEVYYYKHKMQFRNQTVEKWIKERTKIFNKYGWDLIFFEAREVNESNVIERLN